MSFCTNCGNEIKDNMKFCTECGTPFTGEVNAGTPQPETVTPASPIVQEQVMMQTPPPAQTQTPPPVQPVPPVQQVPVQQMAKKGEYVPGADSKYQPISTWGYIGIMLLMCIPIVGFILLIVWAIGGCRKVNKRNLARASLIICAISLVFSLIIGFAVRSVISNALEEAGLSTLLEDNKEEESGGLAALLGQDFSADEEDDYDYDTDSSGYGDLSGLDNSDLSALEGLEGLEGMSELEILSALSGLGGGDTGDMGDLEQALTLLEALSGSGSGSTGENNMDDLLEGIEAANAEAEAINDGWPSDLRPYPSGEGNALASYRTEFTGTTMEEMTGYINDLKSDGYVFQDFYEFGMTEDDMLSMGAWWGTNGKYYLGLSYVEGTVTIDHTTELPDLSDYF